MAVTRRIIMLPLLMGCMILGPGMALGIQDVVAPRDAETLFSRGVSAYDQRHYREAADLLAQLPTLFPQSSRTTGALIMRSKALFALGENMESAKVARTLLSDYPASAYCADAHFVLGSIFSRIGRKEESLKELALAYGALPRPVPPRLQEALGCLVDTVAGMNLSIGEVRNALQDARTREYHARLLLVLAEKYAAMENTRVSRGVLDSLLSEFPEVQGEPRVMNLLGRIAERSNVKLGVLLPLMQKDPPTASKEIAGDVNDGIQYAAEKFSQDPYQRIKVTLITRDTERDPASASRYAREMSTDLGIVGIIGPMFSTTTSAAAAAAQAAGVPLITPTANANGISAAGPYIFQANPDYEMRGRAMARYAVAKKGYRTVAVLAPSDAYGKYLADGFIDEAKHLGASVATVQWYERGKSDLSSQLRNMRKAGLRLGSDAFINFGGRKKLGELMKLVALGVPVKTLDSLLHKGALVNANALVGPAAASRLDSLGITLVYNEVMTDSLDVPVTAIEGVYAPISTAGEVGVVSSQLVYFNIKAQVLGSGEWNSLPDLDEHRRYTTGVVFESDTYVDTTSAAYQGWAAGYKARFHRRPSKNSLFGYDAADLVLGAIRDGAGTRQALARALSEIREFRGLHSAIGFTSRRVNNCLSILQFDGKNIVYLDEVKVE
jgi:ABC-type branched-subunit amino acid transport system substrate-binding protein